MRTCLSSLVLVIQATALPPHARRALALTQLALAHAAGNEHWPGLLYDMPPDDPPTDDEEQQDDEMLDEDDEVDEEGYPSADSTEDDDEDVPQIIDDEDVRQIMKMSDFDLGDAHARQVVEEMLAADATLRAFAQRQRAPQGGEETGLTDTGATDTDSTAAAVTAAAAVHNAPPSNVLDEIRDENMDTLLDSVAAQFQQGPGSHVPPLTTLALHSTIHAAIGTGVPLPTTWFGAQLFAEHVLATNFPALQHVLATYFPTLQHAIEFMTHTVWDALSLSAHAHRLAEAFVPFLERWWELACGGYMNDPSVFWESAYSRGRLCLRAFINPRIPVWVRNRMRGGLTSAERCEVSASDSTAWYSAIVLWLPEFDSGELEDLFAFVYLAWAEGDDKERASQALQRLINRVGRRRARESEASGGASSSSDNQPLPPPPPSHF